MVSKSLQYVAIAIALLLIPGGLACAYTVDNAFDEFGYSDDGLRSIYEMAGFLGKLFLHRELDEQTDAFFEFWNRSLRNFNLKQIYHSPYLDENDDGFHTVTFRGNTLPDRYIVSLEQRQPYNQGLPSRLGNFGAQIGLKRKQMAIDHEGSFEGRIAASLASKNFTHGTLTSWITGMYQVIDPDNIDGLSSLPTKAFSRITGDRRRPIDNYFESFPKQIQFFDRYADLKSFITIDTHHHQRYTRVNIEVVPRLHAIKEDFRHLYGYFRRLEGLYRVSVKLQTRDGLSIMTLGIDTDTLAFHWSFNTRNGLLVPSLDNGEPVFARAFSLSDMDRYPFKAVVDGRIKLYGIRISSGPVTADCEYKRLQSGSDMSIRMVDIPTPKISGRALGFIPIFLVDVLIPSNVEELAHQFVTVLKDGNNGRGSGMHIFWDDTRPRDAMIQINAYTELLDNRFVNFAMKVWSRRIQPDSDTFRDMARFWGYFFKSMLPSGAEGGDL